MTSRPPCAQLPTSGVLGQRFLQTSGHAKAIACAVLCNLVLDFSPVKKELVDRGIVTALAACIRSSDESLRLNAIWALKNLVYLADPMLKLTVKHALAAEGWKRCATRWAVRRPRGTSGGPRLTARRCARQ